LAGILVTAFAGRQMLTLLYRPEYAAHTDVFLWLAVVAAVQYAGGGLSVAATAMRLFSVQAPIQGISLMVTIGVLAVSVPRWGLVGAAWALLASACASRLAFALLLRSRLIVPWTRCIPTP